MLKVSLRINRSILSDVSEVGTGQAIPTSLIIIIDTGLIVPGVLAEIVGRALDLR